MPLTDPCLAEEIVSALVVHMLREGLLDERRLLELDLSTEAREHVKALIVEAAAPIEPRLKVVRDP